MGSAASEFGFVIECDAIRVATLPTDPLFASQWHLLNTGQEVGTSGLSAFVWRRWSRHQRRAGLEHGRARTETIGYTGKGVRGRHNRYRRADWAS